MGGALGIKGGPRTLVEKKPGEGILFGGGGYKKKKKGGREKRIERHHKWNGRVQKGKLGLPKKLPHRSQKNNTFPSH